MRVRCISYRQTLSLDPIASHFLNLETSATRLAPVLLVTHHMLWWCLIGRLCFCSSSIFAQTLCLPFLLVMGAPMARDGPRIDENIIFRPLNREDLREIAKLQLKRVEQRLADRRGQPEVSMAYLIHFDHILAYCLAIGPVDSRFSVDH